MSGIPKAQVRKEHYILLGLNIIFIVGFGIHYFIKVNYEFLIYVGVIVTALILIISSISKVSYSLSTLIGLSVWGLMHLAGGSVRVNEEILYELMFFKIPGDLPILRYDQVVHILGFGVCTLLCYDLIKSRLKSDTGLTLSVSIVLVMAGLGIGAVNEILEFIVTLIVPKVGVGGYINSSLDLCADLVGALLALLYIKILMARGRKVTGKIIEPRQRQTLP